MQHIYFAWSLHENTTASHDLWVQQTSKYSWVTFDVLKCFFFSFLCAFFVVVFVIVVVVVLNMKIHLFSYHFSTLTWCTSDTNWSLGCSWSIAGWRCSNYIFILDLTPYINGLGKNNCKTGFGAPYIILGAAYIRYLSIYLFPKIIRHDEG